MALEWNLTGEASRAMRAFYAALPRVPRGSWPELLHGMGYNFEFYDGLFVLMLANVQLSFDAGDYTPRHRAMQQALIPFCSEFGIELGHGVQRTHRDLYAEFFQIATGRPMPERYPTDDTSPWLAAARRAADEMRLAIQGPRAGSGVKRARFSLGYFWAVEHLSVEEFDLMRAAWRGLGVDAAYLDAHCAVEGDHDAHSTEAVLAFTDARDPIAGEAV
ncbi:MAG TPA: hypothetical protein VHB21_12250, partial [Minicystis sp.]|nr:hypothetical protein [Minicystis sp.]